MERFLEGLLRDLAKRCEVVKERLSAAPADPEVSDRALGAYQVVEQVRREVNSLLGSPGLSSPQLVPNHLQLYKRWYERVALAEYYPLPFIERYGEHDRRLTQFCRRAAGEIGWTLPVPLVAAFSHQYFWTNPFFSLVNIPAVEGTSLLGMPDLFHELGHILLLHNHRDLLGDFLNEVALYIDSERARVDAAQRPPEYREKYDLLFVQWREEWVWEFASDMIATYIVGDAFGWQHLRLCASLSHPPYFPTLGEVAEHPADSARLSGVIAALRELDQSTDSLNKAWDDYMAVLGEARPPDYDLCYPESLLQSLARRVVGGCSSLGLKAIGDDQSTIVRLIGEAWERFRSAPEEYERWERDALLRVWEDLDRNTPSRP